MKYLLLALSLLFGVKQSIGQSCCSGGVPLSNNLGMPSAEAGIGQFSLAYDYNNLNTLRSAWNRLDDQSRQRLTHSLMLNWGINFSNTFSVEGILSYLIQERRIQQPIGSDLARTKGIGDAVILLNFTLLSAPDHALRAALGTKIPIGNFNQRDEQGLIYNAELQPGSGAWDAIGWMQWSQSFSFRPSMGYHLTLAYSHKGENPEYLGDQIYQFGNEIQISTGLSDRLMIGNQLFDPALTIRYRQAGEDLFNRAPLPATGGKWVFLEPALAYWPQPDWSIQFGLSFPVMAYVKDTQFSPTLRSNLRIFHRLQLWNPSKNNFSTFDKIQMP